MQIIVREDKSEQFLYKCAEFPAYFGYGRLADYPDYAALGHWHDDIEVFPRAFRRNGLQCKW